MMTSRSRSPFAVPNLPWTLGIGAFVLFFLTRTRELTTGLPAQLASAVADLYPIPITAHQPYIHVARVLNVILPGGELFALTFLSCVLGALGVALFYQLMLFVPIFYTNVERLPAYVVEKSRHIAASFAALFLAASEPYWRAATQPDIIPLRVCLLLLAFLLLFRYGRGTAPVWALYVSVFVYGLGITEYPSLVAIAPVYGVMCLLQLLRRGQLNGLMLIRVIGAGLLGLLFYLVPPLVVGRTPDYGYGEYTGFWGVILDLWRKQFVEMKMGIPRTGGILVFLAAFAPWAFILFVIRPGQVGSVLARGASLATLLVLTVFGVLLLGGVVEQPFQTLGYGHILPYLSIASWLGYLVGHWWLRVRAPTPVRGPQTEFFRKLRLRIPYAAWILPVVVGTLNVTEIRAAAMTEMTLLARNISKSLGDQTFVVSLGGGIDDLLRYEARGTDRIILAPRELSRLSLRRYLSRRFPRADLNLAGDLTVENTLRALIKAYPDLVDRTALIRPEYAATLGYQFIPNGLVVFPVSQLDAVSPADVFANNEKLFLEVFAPHLSRLKAPELANDYTAFVAREYSRCANNVGTVLRLLNADDLAERAFNWALGFFPENPSALLNRRDLMLRRIAELERKGQPVEALKAQADDELKKAFIFASQNRALMADPLLLTASFGYIYSERMSLELADRFRRAQLTGAESMAIEQARLINPESIPVRFGAAIMFLGQGNEEQAEREYRNILEQIPGDVGARIGLAALAYERKDMERAISLLTDPSVNAEDARVVSMLALLYAGKGDRARAKEYFDRAQKLKLDSALVHSFMAMAALQLGDMQQAADFAQKSLVINPGSLPMLYVLRDTARARADWQSAWNIVNQLRAVDPTNVALHEEAITLSITLGRWTETRRLSQALLDKSPDNFVANMAMASAAAVFDNLSEQERYLRVALQAKEHPFRSAALNNLAYCLAQQQRYDEALPFARDAVRQVPEFDKALHTLATVQLGLKQYAEAEQSILQALTLAPANAHHKVLLAEILLAQGRSADARRLASDAMPELEDKWRIRAERILQQAGT